MDEISLTDVKDFFSFLLKKFWIVLLITFAIFLGGTFYSTYIKVPMYRSTTSIILATNNDASQGSTITTTDISINQNLVNTYAEIIKSRKVLNATISELNLNISYSDLAGSVSVDSKDGTEIITVSVVNKDKVLAKTIADSVANNFKEEVAKIYNMKNVSILDKAEVASRPYNLNAKKEIIIYIVGGLALGIIILFLWFYFDKTIKNSEEVEREIELPIMGKIRDCSKTISKNKIGDKLLIRAMPKSNFAEDVKTVRTNLDFSNMEHNVKRILITSSIMGEGKSFVSANLAASFAQNNKKVILIDCDLRRGVVHKRFGLKNKGLSNLIAKNDLASLSDYICKTNVKNLDVITRGTIPPNPSELLSSRVFKVLLNILDGQYDYIILDGTPVTNLPDSLIVSSYVDKTLIVCSIGYTPIDLLVNTKKSLENVGAPIAGVIVNKVEEKHGGYYYSSYRYE